MSILTLAEFSIEKQLSKSTNREVFLATHPKSGKKVVLKKINKAAVSQDLVDNEIDAGKTLKHPFLVNFITHFEEDGFAYLVVEYIEGKDLFFHMAQKNFERPMPEKEAKMIFRYVFFITSFFL